MSTAGRHAEKKPFSLSALRVKEILRIFTDRYRLHGHVLPDDDSGRDDAFLMLNHLANHPEADRRIPAFLSLWCPWMGAEESSATTRKVLTRPRRWTADKMAARLHLFEHDRKRMKIKSIGAIDLSKAERKVRRKLRDRLLKQASRRQAGRKLRSEYEANSLSRTQPWERLNMSRRSWYRAGKPLPP
jgi:hypothetical protein